MYFLSALISVSADASTLAISGFCATLIAIIFMISGFYLFGAFDWFSHNEACASYGFASFRMGPYHRLNMHPPSYKEQWGRRGYAVASNMR